MKTNKYQKRFYRDWVKSKDLVKTRICVRQTDLEILTDRPIDKKNLSRRLMLYRSDIENYITRDEKFLTSLRPLSVEANAPLIVKEMARQAKIAGVGPMAAVAGAIAGFLGRDIFRMGCKDVIIENGGDIYLRATKPRYVNIYAGNSKLSGKIALKIEPQETPLGVCTSSGSVGHSFSLGNADSVVILARNVALADAVATASANMVKSKEDFKKAVIFASSIRNVRGVLIILGSSIIFWGRIRLSALKR
ncbi:MAG: UPF0280 family protein [Candidatus Omnitrophota bacterium]|nr:UPF0280 family protein [Candidatus Omnitrophota bacterium]